MSNCGRTGAHVGPAQKADRRHLPADKEFYRRPIEATDRQIDALVYELYGLVSGACGDGEVKMRRLVLVASVVITPIVLISLLLGSDGRVTAGIGAVRDTPTQASPSTGRVTETLTPTYIYLPLVCRNFPLVIQVPEGKYLFVEYWTHSVLGVNCPILCIDFPTYHFDPQSGELTTYTTNPPLLDDDVGYIGSGESLGGVGMGASSHLIRIQWCPWPEDGITLRYVDEAGTVTLEREGEVIVLEANETWVSDEETEVWDGMEPECVVTSTHYITNYAFQDRDKIICAWP